MSEQIATLPPPEQTAPIPKDRQSRRPPSSERPRRHHQSPPRRHHSPRRHHRRERSRSREHRNRTNEHKQTRREQKTEEQKKEEAKKRDEAAARASLTVTRGGGVYIPPHKLARMQHNILAEGPESVGYQKYMFENLRKSINGIVNKVNTTNIQNVLFELFHENLLRGRGLLCRAILKAQMASPNFSHVYAALIAVVNTKLPDVGRLLVERVLAQFERSFKAKTKIVCTAATKMLAHLVNQQVVHELIALEMLVLFLETPTEDSVEMATELMKECGQVLSELTPAGVNSIFERFRGILHQGQIDKRVQYTIENLFAVRRSKFRDHPGVIPQLDLVEQDDKITHQLSLDDGPFKSQVELDLFHFDRNWQQAEDEWTAIRQEILGEEELSAAKRQAKLEALEQEGALDDVLVGEEAVEATPGELAIADLTEQDLKNLRRVVYLTIMSSVEYEECAHKLLKLKIREGQEIELCNMIMECCMQERTYLRFYGLLAQRFCVLDERYQTLFQDECFPAQYGALHRLETNMLRNLAKFFAHLVFTEAVHWRIWKGVRLTEDDTTAASRIFIKVEDPDVKEYLQGLFPRDSLAHVRFSINFFTSIELGVLTEGQRAFLEDWPKLLMQKKIEKLKNALQNPGELSSSSSDDSDSDSDSSGSSSGSETD